MNPYVGRCGHPVPLDHHPSADDAAPVGRVSDSQLAVLFRQAQWALDDAAHDFPAGRSTPLRRTELAGTLEALATIVRASVPPIAPPAPEPTDRETLS